MNNKQTPFRSADSYLTIEKDQRKPRRQKESITREETTIQKNSQPSEKPADFSIHQADSGKTLILFKGSLDKGHIMPLWEKTNQFLIKEKPTDLVFDFREVTGFDTAGMALLRTLEIHCRDKELNCERRNLPEEMSRYLQYMSERKSEEAPETAAQPGDRKSVV